MSKLKEKIKVTRDPILFVGQETNGKWRIEKSNGKLDSQVFLSKWEAKEAAIQIAAIDNSKDKTWRNYKAAHSDVLRSFIQVTTECF